MDPGAFELSNLSVPIGTSHTRLVIRDAFGREQEVTRPDYLANSVLAKGLHDYGTLDSRAATGPRTRATAPPVFAPSLGHNVTRQGASKRARGGAAPH